MAGTLSIGKKHLVKRLIKDGFDTKRPYIQLAAFDGSLRLLNIEGWRSNTLPAVNDPELLELCGPDLKPVAVSSEEIQYPNLPVVLVESVRGDVKFYRHVSEDAYVYWLPQKPANILVPEVEVED